MTIDTTGTRGGDVATFDPSTTAYPVLFMDDSDGGIAKIVQDNFGDEGFNPGDLDRYHVQPGGVTRWINGDDEESDTLTGVAVLWGVTRAWWEKPRDEAGDETQPPDCASADGKYGIGRFGKLETREPGSDMSVHPSGACEDCPMNQWESGKGRSKACKEQRQIWLLLEGSILPVRVTLPPTSIGPWRKYMTRVAGQGKSYYAVVTELSLERKRMGGNQVAVVKAKKVRDLDPAEVRAAEGYGLKIEQLLFDSIRAEVQGEAVPSGAASAATGTGQPDEPMDPWADEDAASTDLGDVPPDLQD